MARIEIAETFSTVLPDNANLVHLSEPHFGLQASLVGRACRRNYRSYLRASRGKCEIQCDTI